MVYLSSFTFPDAEAEADVRMKLKPTFHQTMYPFFTLAPRGIGTLYFRPVTILYGGNGSGKTTVLNVIAEKLGLERGALYNRSAFFERYTHLCSFETEEDIPAGSRIVTSDDVFDLMLDIRSVNRGIDRKREETAEEYFRMKREGFTLSGIGDYEQLRRVNRARSKTLSRFTEEETGRSVRERSNGESAQLYFGERIESDTLCLLDEPENSLSPENQMRLSERIEESARYLGCQFVIATHSPFLLALPGARIIDLEHPERERVRWTELESVRAYRKFFEDHEKEFLEEDAPWA